MPPGSKTHKEDMTRVVFNGWDCLYLKLYIGVVSVCRICTVTAIEAAFSLDTLKQVACFPLAGIAGLPPGMHRAGRSRSGASASSEGTLFTSRTDPDAVL